MQDGVFVVRHEGTPQGGPLSPLLANLLLDDLDRELSRRGHTFCRYADDCNIYVRSQAAGERVLASITAFLECRLRLRVNRQKSAVARSSEWGDSWTFIALESNTKLVLTYAIGQRDMATSTRFLKQLDRATSGRFQLSTDGLGSYTLNAPFALGSGLLPGSGG